MPPHYTELSLSIWRVAALGSRVVASALDGFRPLGHLPLTYRQSLFKCQVSVNYWSGSVEMREMTLRYACNAKSGVKDFIGTRVGAGRMCVSIDQRPLDNHGSCSLCPKVFIRLPRNYCTYGSRRGVDSYPRPSAKYYHEPILMGLGNMVGRAIRIDLKSEMSQRGGTDEKTSPATLKGTHTSLSPLRDITNRQQKAVTPITPSTEPKINSKKGPSSSLQPPANLESSLLDELGVLKKRIRMGELCWKAVQQPVCANLEQQKETSEPMDVMEEHISKRGGITSDPICKKLVSLPVQNEI
ncbi:hypothetical protein Scep_002232 [Stephania cephalantha]|uniref:Uncharacterized protein n=1 Tax=Stephania cephalantha TaxID=152367 RepID=A0AAP0L9W0_9MAGN